MKDENYYVSLPAKEHIQTSSLASGCRSTLRALRKWDANCYCLTGIKNENTEIGSAPPQASAPCNVSSCESLVSAFYSVEFDSEYGPIDASFNGLQAS